MKKIFTYLFLSLPFWLVCQDKAYKEIKSLDQTLECKEGDWLSINGERTFINLRSWDKDLIQLNVQVVSKHKDQSQAKLDLDKIQVVFDKKGKEFIYSNSIKINSPKDKPLSNLKVLLEVTVPEYLRLDIKNKFGKIDMQGKFSFIASNSQFTSLMIDDLETKARIKTEYGDAEFKDFSGELTLEADRSNVVLDNVVSQLDVDMKYGELKMHLQNAIQDQKIKAQFSPVNIEIEETFKNKVSLNCSNCKIESNDDSALSNFKSDDEDQSATISGSKGELELKSEIEDIEIIFKNKLSNSN